MTIINATSSCLSGHGSLCNELNSRPHHGDTTAALSGSHGSFFSDKYQYPAFAATPPVYSDDQQILVATSPPLNGTEPILILDIDDTFIHAFNYMKRAELQLPGFDPSQILCFITMGIHCAVFKRPRVEASLQEMAKHYQLGLWTATGLILKMTSSPKGCIVQNALNYLTDGISRISRNLMLTCPGELILNNSETWYVLQPIKRCAN